MMRSASRQALSAVRAQQEEVLGGRVSAQTLTSVADELYAVAGFLVGQPLLRRTLGDPATSPDARSQLARQLFGEKISSQAQQLLETAVSQRWSSPWDLTDALEGAGDDALFAAAEKQKGLDQIEDDLFRFERILDADGELAALLDEFTAPAQRRVELIESLLSGKVDDITLQLLRHAVASERKRSLALAIDDLLEAAAQRQERSVARVLSAVPLSDEQEQRLADVLSGVYGRAISVRTAIDPAVRGGLVVRVGDEVIDGSVSSRFAEIRSALAG